MKNVLWSARGSLLFALLLSVSCWLLCAGCRPREERLQPRSLTWAELRSVRSGVRITPPGEASRLPYARERLADGSLIELDEGAIAWLRRDGGATLLLRGPAALTLRAQALRMTYGRIFADMSGAGGSELETPAGSLTLSGVRASIELSRQGELRAYVLSGEVRAQGRRARAGEELVVAAGRPPQVRPLRAWEDWTGGLATTDRAAAPTPFGVGSVGARRPSEQGEPRFPLAIQRMDVRVTFDRDLAITEVDQTFFNPSSDVVEGLYSFRTPERATLQRFGVDREGVIVWGRVKEKSAAAAQYKANVYEGSAEDPALLEWDAPGVYRARLYPIGPGATRRVVVRYAEWLERSGARGERRLYVYPMAAEGTEESLPRIEELKVSFDLAKSGARDVRVGMAGERRGNELLVRAHDFVPRADLALELFDAGPPKEVAYRAPHARDFDALPPSERTSARERARAEADYVLVPVRASQATLPAGGLDLAIVIDASAGTDAATLALARAATTALLAQLDERDRALVLAGDSGLRPVLAEFSRLSKMDGASRSKIRDALSALARGGATDLGAMLSDAARELDPARRSALVYIGDANPTVGELTLPALRERLARLPRPARVFGLGLGDGARMDLLAGLTRSGTAERITDAAQAARAALHVLERAELPAWLGSNIELGPNVERVFPRDTSAMVAGETSWLIGRAVGGKSVERVRITSAAGTREIPLASARIDDGGDLTRRWAEARLAQMLEDGEGRAALVDLGVKGGIITPFTSLYVPTANEMSSEERRELEARSRAQRRAAPGAARSASKYEATADKEGGTGTRAKDDAKGNEAVAAAAPAEAPVRKQAEAAPLPTLAKPAAPEPAAPQDEKAQPASPRQQALSARRAAGAIAPFGRDPEQAREDTPEETNQKFGATIESLEDNDSIGGLAAVSSGFVGGGLGLSGTGAGGGARGKELSASGQGFGAGHGRLGGAQKTSAPLVRMGRTTVDGALPPEVIQRIVRQSFGRFRQCFEQGLARNPNLTGLIRTRFTIGGEGEISNIGNAGSDLADSDVVSCVQKAFGILAFPQPERGNVRVVIPLEFRGGAAGGDASKPRLNINVFIGDLPRELLGCSAAAWVPLESRVPLWRERLVKVSGRPDAAAQLYRSALVNCEAPTFRERSRLLTMMLDVMPGVTQKVSLYRAMLGDLGAADVLYRGLLARITTPEQMRELHEALGLKDVDRGILEKLVSEPMDAATRAARLGAMAQQFPDDFALGLAFLDALEDAGAAARIRDVARGLRQRADADARVRTAIGELYLRLAASAQAANERAQWSAEAQRAFGEIVEYAPSDPVARRRLGDLLLSHGFFADARRQYETLAQLTPDDSRVFLCLGAAAQGQGLLEEALKWIEKASMAGASESDAATAARSLATTYLAWAREEARVANRAEELAALSARASRLLAAGGADPERPLGARLVLTWSHPEFHPTLWSNALGTTMPASQGDVSAGVSQVELPERDSSFVEVRLEPQDVAHAARLGAEATLTAVFDELGPQEKIVRVKVRFARGAPPIQRFVVSGKEVHRG